MSTVSLRTVIPYLFLIHGPLQVITMNGSVRIKTCDLELSQQTILEVSGNQGATSGSSQMGAATGNGPASGSSAAAGEDGQRAVDNQYSYV